MEISTLKQAQTKSFFKEKHSLLPPLFHSALFWLSLLFTLFALPFMVNTYKTTYSPLFSTPKKLRSTRKELISFWNRYQKNKTFWDDQLKKLLYSPASKDQPLNKTLQKIAVLPKEFYMAFYSSYILSDPHTFNPIISLKKMRNNSFKVTLSKYESSRWFFKAMLSCEILVSLDRTSFSMKPLRFCKGTKELASSLSWSYFGAELSRMESVLSSIYQHKVYGNG